LFRHSPTPFLIEPFRLETTVFDIDQLTVIETI
jgi:hypothetical protein